MAEGWSSNDVHRELCELSGALQAKSRALGRRCVELDAREADLDAREVALSSREGQLAQDRRILMDLLAKEAARLYQDGHARLETVVGQQTRRLESICNSLHAQHAEQRTEQPARPPLADEDAGRGNGLPKTVADGPKSRCASNKSPAASSQPANIAAIKLREMQQHLSKSRALAFALLTELEEVQTASDRAALSPWLGKQHVKDAWRRALPGAAELLLSDSTAVASHHHRLLIMLWFGVGADQESSDLSSFTQAASVSQPLPQWERRLARHLVRAAAVDASPIFGRTSSTAPLAALLLLRLSMRAQHSVRRGAGAAGNGIRDACEALSYLRQLTTDSACRASLLSWGAVDELTPLVKSPLSVLARPAAATLLGLCAATEPHESLVESNVDSVDFLATHSFVQAACSALTLRSSKDVDCFLAASVSTLLQRLSICSKYRHLFDAASRRSISSALMDFSDDSSDQAADRHLTRCNLRSIVNELDLEGIPEKTAISCFDAESSPAPTALLVSAANTQGVERSSIELKPDFQVQWASPGSIVPATPD